MTSKFTNPIRLSSLTEEELFELIHELNDTIAEHNKGSVNGLFVQDGFRELVEQIYPDDQDMPFRKIVRDAQKKVFAYAAMRYNFAISGAMRWESSQEAAIRATGEYNLRVI